MRTRVVITMPSLGVAGGVAGFYRSILPFLTKGGVDACPVHIGNKGGAGWVLRYLRDQVRLFSVLCRPDTALLHVNPSLDLRSFIRDGLFVLQARVLRIPVVVFFHGWQVSFEDVVDRYLRFFFALSYARAAQFMVLSPAFARTLRRWGVSAPIRIATTAVDDELLAGFCIRDRISELLKAPRLRILFLARLEVPKGVLVTIEAAGILARSGVDVHLDIAGDGAAAAAARDLAAATDALSGRVRFLGYVQGRAKRDAFVSAHVYCLPSESEGMPASLLEAMGYGMPVVTTLVGGIKDFFREGEMGYATASVSPAAIAELLRRLIADRDKMARMAHLNHEYVKEHCLASRVALDLGQCYRDAGLGPELVSAG